jgi:hypothetical protein
LFDVFLFSKDKIMFLFTLQIIMTLKNSLKQIIKFTLSFVAISSLIYSPIRTFSQTNNPISFGVSFVTVDGKKVETKNVGVNSWRYDGELKDSDFIRYGWQNAAIDLSYKQSPKAGGGWLRVYLNDDTKSENAIVDFGTSPLPVSAIASRLSPGQNKILFVFVNDNNDPARSNTKVNFTFNYKNNNLLLPQANLIEPTEGSLLMDNANRKFRLELTNFALEEGNSNSNNKGQLKVYLNEIKDKPLATIKTSKEVDATKQIVEFSNKDFDPEVKVPDSKNTKFIYVLNKSNGEVIGTPIEKVYNTNFGGTLKDIGIPEVTIVEPKSDRVDLGVDGDRKFILEVKNFEMLKEIGDAKIEDKKGYLQIFVDNQPIKTIWGNTEFTLNEIGYGEVSEGKKNIKVQLVNKDFTKLSPEASANLDIIYKPKVSNNNSQDNNINNTNVVENSNWRLIIIVLIILLIIGGIVVLVTKG